MKDQQCWRCALLQSNRGICPVFKRDTSAEAGCPLFSSALYQCEICGAHITEEAIISQEEEQNHLMCANCASQPLCGVCVRAQECLFRTDQSCVEPPMITATQRQGNAVIQTQIPNPKRVKMLCVGCPCYSGKDVGEHCFKDLGFGCKNHKTNWRN